MKIWVYLSLICILFISCQENKKSTVIPQNTIEIEDELNRLISEEPENPHLYFQRGNMFYEKGEYDKSIVDLQKAVSLAPKIEYVHQLADALFDGEKTEESIQTLSHFIEKNPPSIATSLKLSELQMLTKQNKESIVTLENILKRHPQNAEAFFMLGLNYKAMKEPTKAINALQSAVENDSDLYDGWMALATLFKEKDPMMAFRYYDNAAKVNPESPEPLFAKAEMFENMGNTANALSLYQRINTKFKDYIPSFQNAGMIYLHQNKLDKAKEHFNVIVQQYPKSPVGYFYLAQVAIKQNDNSNAKRLLQNSLSLNPEFAEAEELLKSIK